MPENPQSAKSHPLASIAGLRERFLSNRRRLATFGAGALTLAVGYHVVCGANGLTVYMQKRHEERALEQQMQQLQRENELLKDHVGRLQSDPSAIEHQAREDLHYTRPGEVIYTLDDPQRSIAVDAKAPSGSK